MRVLFLTDPAPDYLADLTYIGLCRILGEEHVVDFPSKKTYHEPQHRVHYIPQVAAHPYQEHDILAFLRAGHFDIAILSSPRAGVVRALKALSQHVSMPPLIVIDGEDDASIRSELWDQSNAMLYFKRELHDNGRTKHRDRLMPLSLSIVQDQLPTCPPAERLVDVSYAGRVSHPRRKHAVDLLSKAPVVRFEGHLYADTTDRQSKLLTGVPRLWAKLMGDPLVPVDRRGTKLDPHAYYRLMTRSKMALSVRGGGFDTLRYWEIPAMNTVLLSEEPDIEIANNFVHGQSALFFKPDLSNLLSLVQTYADEPRVCAEIAQRGMDHLARYHTCEKRAEYLIETCRRKA
jgi:Glycosyl transferases group 1